MKPKRWRDRGRETRNRFTHLCSSSSYRTLIAYCTPANCFCSFINIINPLHLPWAPPFLSFSSRLHLSVLFYAEISPTIFHLPISEWPLLDDQTLNLDAFIILHFVLLLADRFEDIFAEKDGEEEGDAAGGWSWLGYGEIPVWKNWRCDYVLFSLTEFKLPCGF